MSEAVPTFPPRLVPVEDPLDSPLVDPATAVVETAETAYPAPRGPRPTEAPAGVEISYEQFGRAYVRRVLNLPRVLSVIDALLGPTIELGPIGAGPGRAFASVSIVGHFKGTSGRELPGDLLTYAIDLPISVVFTLDLPVDSLTFNADVVVPLTLVVHTAAPTVLRMELDVPAAEEVELRIQPSTRRGALFQKLTGLESELRRFLIKVVSTELSKPYIKRAMELDMEELIEKSWDDLSRHFLPRGPEDRKS